MKMLSARDITVEFGGIKVLENVGFDVEKGDVLAIIGPNGAGKTVLLKALLNLTRHSGTVEWAKGITVGYVPQRMDIETDVPITVKEFMNLRGKPFTKEKLKTALGYVQLDEDVLKRGFGELSVGQRQRVLVAWAVIGEPDALLFDEPTADVDIAGQGSIYNMLYRLQKETGLTVILVSHDLNVVYKHATSVLCLNRKSMCLGAPKQVLTTEQLQRLYGAESAFFKHEHHH